MILSCRRHWAAAAVALRQPMAIVSTGQQSDQERAHAEARQGRRGAPPSIPWEPCGFALRTARHGAALGLWGQTGPKVQQEKGGDTLVCQEERGAKHCPCSHEEGSSQRGLSPIASVIKPSQKKYIVNDLAAKNDYFWILEFKNPSILLEANTWETITGFAPLKIRATYFLSCNTNIWNCHFRDPWRFVNFWRYNSYHKIHSFKVYKLNGYQHICKVVQPSPRSNSRTFSSPF